MAKGIKTGGRTIGSGNKANLSMKQTVEQTLRWLQTQPRSNMRDWAKENPTEFYRIAAKLIPTQITGDNDAPLICEVRFKDS